MRHKLPLVCLGLSALLTAPVFGEEGIKRPVEITSTERFDFAPGGIIRVEDSYGDLNVEGWDQAAVEVTVTKSKGEDYAPEKLEHEKERLEHSRILVERHSDTELVIFDDLPRFAHIWPPLSRSTKGVLVDCEIHVPRDARLIIHHGKGYVSVSDVTGEIQATTSSGDILVTLPGPGPYSIDAKCRFGKVDSDFAGATHKRYLLGERFEGATPSGSRHIYLRASYGGITIKQAPPESETPEADSPDTVITKAAR